MTYSGVTDSIYIDHEQYYGLFVLSDCTVSDFGTTFATNHGCWQRVFDNYSPRFWPLSGLASAGQLRTINAEVDAINAAAYAAWKSGGDTIEIDRIYELDGGIWLLENNTYLGVGDSVGFKRKTPPKTALTHPAQVGDSKLYVTDNSGFRTFQKINIASAQAYDSISKHISYTASISHALGGDTTIFLSGRKITKAMQAGDSVSLFFPMMYGVSWAKADNISLKKLVFDGNRSEYTLNFDWRVNTSIQWPTNTGSVIDNCRFYNIPSENVFLCGTRVINSKGAGFNGSVLHFSCNATGSPTEVLYNDFSQLNQVGNDLMQHSEAAMTFSSRVRNFRISYNNLSSLEEFGFGMVANDDTSNIITDNLINTALEEVAYRPFYNYESTNTIYNNKNLLRPELSNGSCLLNQVNSLGELPCKAGSSLERPLEMGELIHIRIDSLLALNSNNNFVKGIFFRYDNAYFDLVGAEMYTPNISPHHNWSFQTYDDTPALVFDNGHQSGIDGQGNWGYEPCGVAGGCTNLKIYFRVKRLPESTSAVPCPLEGLEIKYDSQMNTWDNPVLCSESTRQFDQAILGKPVLTGSSSCPGPQSLQSTRINKTTMQLSWAMSDNASQYLIWYKPKSDSQWNKVMSWSGATTKRIKRLTPNTDYVWRVQAKCDDQWGIPSELAEFSTTPPGCENISFSGLQTTHIEQNRAMLNWNFIENVRVNIWWREEGTIPWNKKTVRGAFRLWLEGLEPGKTYEWQIRAVCLDEPGLQTSAWSPRQTFATLPDAPQAGQVRNATDFNHSLTSDLSKEVTVFPNPANKEVIVSTRQGLIHHITMIDLSGNVISDASVESHKYRLPLNDVSKGIYVLAIHMDLGITFKKLIVE